MSGHSKWSSIKHKKGAADAKRGKIFTKLIREITVSARQGGPDEAANSRLRDAVSKALKANMKRDTIDNSIKRGVGDLDGAEMIEMRYEGYGPAGVAILVDCLSDNKNRTVSEVRHAFTKYGGNLGTDGSVAYLFNKQGEILLASTPDHERAMDVAIEAGADDVILDGTQLEVMTPPDGYHALLLALRDAGFDVEQSHVTMRAQTLVALKPGQLETLEKLIDVLEDLDDVQEVYSNVAFPEGSEESD